MDVSVWGFQDTLRASVCGASRTHYGHIWGFEAAEVLWEGEPDGSITMIKDIWTYHQNANELCRYVASVTSKGLRSVSVGRRWCGRGVVFRRATAWGMFSRRWRPWGASRLSSCWRAWLLFTLIS